MDQVEATTLIVLGTLNLIATAFYSFNYLSYSRINYEALRDHLYNVDKYLKERISISDDYISALLTLKMKHDANYHYLFNSYLCCLLKSQNISPTIVVEGCIKQCLVALNKEEVESIRELYTFLMGIRESFSDEINFTINQN